MFKKKNKVLVALSGGVDSSVAAYLLQREGYDVSAAFMINWTTERAGLNCNWKKDRRDALCICAQLGIKCLTFDFEKYYRKKVYSYMINEYKKARTPNPDILCNKIIKFGLLMQKAKSLGYDFIATGHYARIKKENIDNKDIYSLYKGVDDQKDQSYFLYKLSQRQLSKVLFPLGELKKEQVRKIAQKNNLHTAFKKDSQGICFIGKTPLKQFLKKDISFSKGKIINENNEVIGCHDGVQFYTIGQRKGLNVRKGGPYYVVERDSKNNILYVTSDVNDKRLYCKSLKAVSAHWIADDYLQNIKLCAKIRYRQSDQPADIHIYGNKSDVVYVNFEKKQWAAAVGQSVVFYKDAKCLGGAIIESS
jgi:tRNA-specific 2-thiouridylase